MSKKYSADQVKALLRKRSDASTQYKTALELGISPSILADVLQGRRDPGPKLLRGLHLRKVVIYETID